MAVGAARLPGVLAALDRDALGLTICEVGGGARLSTPSVEGVAAMLVLSGIMTLEITGHTTLRVRNGELILVPAGTRAEMRQGSSLGSTLLSGTECLVRRNGVLVADASMGAASLLRVAAARIAGTAGTAFPAPVVIPLNRDLLGRQTVMLIRSELMCPGAGSAAYCEALMSACIIIALRLALGNGTERIMTVSSTGERIALVVAAVNARPGDPYTVDMLADIAGMSRSTFLRSFSREMQISPMGFVLKTRLTEAAAALRTGQVSIKRVAAQTGFVNSSHFARAFRRQHGIEPAKYRDDLATQRLNNAPECVTEKQ